MLHSHSGIQPKQSTLNSIPIPTLDLEPTLDFYSLHLRQQQKDEILNSSCIPQTHQVKYQLAVNKTLLHAITTHWLTNKALPTTFSLCSHWLLTQGFHNIKIEKSLLPGNDHDLLKWQSALLLIRRLTRVRYDSPKTSYTQYKIPVVCMYVRILYNLFKVCKIYKVDEESVILMIRRVLFV